MCHTLLDMNMKKDKGLMNLNAQPEIPVLDIMGSKSVMNEWMNTQKKKKKNCVGMSTDVT